MKAFDRCKVFEEERRRIEVRSPHPVFKKLLANRVESVKSIKNPNEARKDEDSHQVYQELDQEEKEEKKEP